MGRPSREAVREWRRRNPDAWHATQARWREKNRDKLRKDSAAYRLTHPDPRTTEDRRQYKGAHYLVQLALRDGRLFKPDLCDRCFLIRPLDAHHHNGYEYPLDVTWLCRACHRFVHGRRHGGAVR